MGSAGTDVLVVGAGPTGLTLANELTRWGTEARVVEKASTVSQHTKALGVQARTLEVFERLGLTQAMVERGLPVTVFNIVSESKPIARFDLGGIDSPYPFLLMLPQNAVEELLHERLVASGVDVDHNTELVDVDDRGDHVDVGLRAADGSVERTSARWVVGCDGAHSTVRHLLGVPFRGSAFEQRFAVADVELDWTLPQDEVFAFLNRGRFMAFFPMTRGRHRIAIADPAADERPGEVSPADLQEALTAIGPPGRIREVHWASRFRERIELAISQIDVAYPESPINSGSGHQRPGPGDRAPDGRLRDRDGEEIRLFDLLREPRYTMLEFADRPGPAETVVRLGTRRRFLGHYRLVGEGGAAGGTAGNELVDPGGRVRSRYGLPGGGSILVRPDGYIAARGDGDDAGVRAFLGRWLTDAPGSRSQTLATDR